MANPLIFVDEYYRRCISLALKSKGKERYGSLLVKDGAIIGEGFNRAIAHVSFGKLERVIRQGMANHAEVEAINDAISRGENTKGASLYVAGFFPSQGLLFFKNAYTCVRCLPHIKAHEICCICIPKPKQWFEKSLSAALTDAEKFKNGSHQKRLDAMIGKYSIDQLNFL